MSEARDEKPAEEKKEEASADKKEEKKEEAPAEKKDEAPAEKKEEAPAEEKKEEPPRDALEQLNMGTQRRVFHTPAEISEKRNAFEFWLWTTLRWVTPRWVLFKSQNSQGTSHLKLT